MCNQTILIWADLFSLRIVQSVYSLKTDISESNRMLQVLPRRPVFVEFWRFFAFCFVLFYLVFFVLVLLESFLSIDKNVVGVLKRTLLLVTHFS